MVYGAEGLGADVVGFNVVGMGDCGRKICRYVLKVSEVRSAYRSELSGRSI